MKQGVSRRDALKLFAGTGLVAANGGIGLNLANAQAAAAGAANGGGFNRIKIGDSTVIVLSDGQTPPGPLLPNWGANPELKADFEKTLQEAFINPAAARNNFNPVYVDTGKNKVLIDTGLGVQAQAGAPVGRLIAHLESAGVKASEIDTVFITHGHGDHIGGMTGTDGKPLFPNAKYIMGETEHTFWTKPATGEVGAGIKKNVIGVQDRLTLIKAGAEIVPGLTSVDSPGHTPGHLSVLISSGNQQMMAFADAAGHWLLSLQYPQAYLGFDNNKELVVQTRAKLFDRVSSEKMLATGYHFPWPGACYIRKRAAGGYEFIPAAFSF